MTATDDAVTAPLPGRFEAVGELFRDPDYRNYWGASAVFGMGIWAFLTAFGWSAAQLTDSAFQVSLVTVVYFSPFFVMAIPAGVLADNVDRKRMAIGWRGFGAVVGVVMAVLAATDNLTYPLLLVGVFLVGLTVIMELASRQAFVAELVPVEVLVQASALSSVQGGIMRVAGPLMAGALIDTVGDGGGYGLFAATGFVFVWAYGRIQRSGEVIREEGHVARPWQEFLDGMRYLGEHRDALAVVLISILGGVVGWLYLALMPVVARDVLDGDAVTLGLMAMAVGIGSLPGTIGLSFVRTGFTGEGRLLVVANLVWAAGIIGFAYATTLPLSLLALFVSGLGNGLVIVVVRTILLRIVEQAYRGRVLGTMMLTWGANIVGTLAGGSLAELVGVSTVIAASGALILAMVLAVATWNRNVWSL